MADPTTVLQRVIRAPQHISHSAVVHETGFGELMDKIARYKSPLVRFALEFLAHTFVRPGELRFATWDEIDLEDSVWRIPEERMKMRRPHDVPLVPATRALLRSVSRLTGRLEGLIFPSPQTWRQPMSENTLNHALWTMGYKGKHTSHGFRASASTILNERGYRKDVIEFQLAHVESNEVRRAYNRAQYWDQRVQMMRDWADIIAELRKKVASKND
jgi:integrase